MIIVQILITCYLELINAFLVCCAHPTLLNCPYLLFYILGKHFFFSLFFFLFLHYFKFQWQTHSGQTLIHLNCTLIAAMLHRLWNIVNVQYLWLFRAYLKVVLNLKSTIRFNKKTNVPTDSKIDGYTANKNVSKNGLKVRGTPLQLS